MTHEEIHAIARQHQIEFDGLTTNEIIRKIQLRKGQFDSFATAYGGECKYAGCQWRDACFAAVNTIIPTEFQ